MVPQPAPSSSSQGRPSSQSLLHRITCRAAAFRLQTSRLEREFRKPGKLAAGRGKSCKAASEQWAHRPCSAFLRGCMLLLMGATLPFYRSFRSYKAALGALENSPSVSHGFPSRPPCGSGVSRSSCGGLPKVFAPDLGRGTGVPRAFRTSLPSGGRIQVLCFRWPSAGCRLPTPSKTG